MSEFKIEVGKSYRTRDGRKATVTMPMPHKTFPFCGQIVGDSSVRSWTDDGLWACDSIDALDLIAPWEETPATLCASDASSAFNAQAEVTRTPLVHDLIKTRAKTHGEFFVNSFVSQSIKNILREEPGWIRLNIRQQEALDHICGKLGRIMAGDPYHRDHWADVAGYAQLVVDGLEGVE